MRKFSSKLAGQQSGFTLIELVIVIVIIGILAAVAIPQFADLTQDAKQSAVEAKASNLASAQAANYAVCKGGLVNATCKGTAGTGYTTCQTAFDGLLGADTTVTVTYVATAQCKLTAGTGTGAPTKTVAVVNVSS